MKINNLFPRASLSINNLKLHKSNTLNDNYASFGLSLAPASTSGNNVCSSSSEGCRKACIFTSGNAMIFPKINKIRIKKTRSEERRVGKECRL